MVWLTCVDKVILQTVNTATTAERALQVGVAGGGIDCPQADGTVPTGTGQQKAIPAYAQTPNAPAVIAQGLLEPGLLLANMPQANQLIVTAAG